MKTIQFSYSFQFFFAFCLFVYLVNLTLENMFLQYCYDLSKRKIKHFLVSFRNSLFSVTSIEVKKDIRIRLKSAESKLRLRFIQKIAESFEVKEEEHISLPISVLKQL